MIECIVFSMHTIGTVRYLAFRSIVSEVSYISRSSSSPHAKSLSVLWSLIHWSRDTLCVVHTYLKNQPKFSKGLKVVGRYVEQKQRKRSEAQAEHEGFELAIGTFLYESQGPG